MPHDSIDTSDDAAMLAVAVTAALNTLDADMGKVSRCTLSTLNTLNTLNTLDADAVSPAGKVPDGPVSVPKASAAQRHVLAHLRARS